MEIIVGFKEHSHKSTPFLVYLGAKDRAARAKALAEAATKGFVRVRAIRNPLMFPVKLDVSPEALANAQAEAKAQREAEAKAQAQREAEAKAQAQREAEARELVELRSEVEGLRAKNAELESSLAESKTSKRKT
jgi:hypothetical protein